MHCTPLSLVGCLSESPKAALRAGLRSYSLEDYFRPAVVAHLGQNGVWMWRVVVLLVCANGLFLGRPRDIRLPKLSLIDSKVLLLR